MRKILFFLLLITGWAIIFWPIYSDDLARSSILFSDARPSDKPLPPAWQDTERVQVRSLDDDSSRGFPVTSLAVAGNCGDSYIVQGGDTLGEIARDCSVSLAELLAANPHIQNFNRVYSGQVITMPDPQAGRGGVDPADPVDPIDPSVATVTIVQDEGAAPFFDQPARFPPGGQVKIEVGGLPPSTPVRIGLGLTTSGFFVLAQAQTSADGRISTTLALPTSAVPGDAAFIMVSTRGTPSVQRMSDIFYITEQ